MKKRRSVFGAFILLALLCLGFGYAALVDSLNINGSVATSADNVTNTELFDVQWKTVGTPAVTKVGASAVTATAAKTDETNATLTISNMALYGEKVVVVYTVENVEKTAGYDANVTVDVKVNGAAPDSTLPFDISATFADANAIANGATKDLTVTVSMKNVLIDTAQNYMIVITLNATADK